MTWKHCNCSPENFSTIWNLLEYVDQYHKMFYCAFLYSQHKTTSSQYQTPSVLATVSCDSKSTILPFTLKEVQTWGHCNRSPAVAIQHEMYWNMWFSPTKCSPTLCSNSQEESLSVMSIVSCDAKITTIPFTHKVVMTWKHCNRSPAAFLQVLIQDRT